MWEALAITIFVAVLAAAFSYRATTARLRRRIERRDEMLKQRRRSETRNLS